MKDENPEKMKDFDTVVERAEALLKNADELMELTKEINPELIKPKEEDIVFNTFTHSTLISIIKDLQQIGIDGKNPKKVLKELKKLRKSRIPEPYKEII